MEDSLRCSSCLSFNALMNSSIVFFSSSILASFSSSSAKAFFLGEIMTLKAMKHSATMTMPASAISRNWAFFLRSLLNIGARLAFDDELVTGLVLLGLVQREILHVIGVRQIVDEF